MINEIIFLSIIFLSGSTFTYVLLQDKHVPYALGFIIGSAMQIVIGTFLVITGLPVSPIVNVCLVFLVSIVCFVFRKKFSFIFKINILKASLFMLLSVFVISIVVYNLFNEGWVKYTNDSTFFLSTIQTLARSGGSALELWFSTTRTYGMALLHLPATVIGELYIRTVFPLLGISLVLALMWFVYRGGFGKVRTRKLITLVILSGLLLISNNRYVFNAFYIHTNLLCAAMALTISACGWLMIHDKTEYQNRYLAIISVTLFALIVSRAESVIIGFMALIPLISIEKVVSIRQKQLLLFAYGLPTTLYYGFVIYTQGGDILNMINTPALYGMSNLTPIIYCLFGLLVIFVAFLLGLLYKLKLFSYLSKKAGVIVESGLWVFLLFYFITESRYFVLNIYSIYENFILGEGAWGLSVVFLTLLMILAILLVKKPDSMAVLRFPITTFMPVMMLTAYLAGGHHMTGPGGSMNRMFIQIVPLTILYIVMSVALGEMRFIKRIDSNDLKGIDEKRLSAEQEMR